MLIIKEMVLHNLWMQHILQIYTLYSQEGKPIKIISPGQYNNVDGPDFLNAIVVIDGIEMHGHIELHINSKDWLIHKHSVNRLYHNIILHVVWNHDRNIEFLIDRGIQTLELKRIISEETIEKRLLKAPNKSLLVCNGMNLGTYLDRNSSFSYDLFQERIFQKKLKFLKAIKKAKYDWQQIWLTCLIKRVFSGQPKELASKIFAALPGICVNGQVNYEDALAILNTVLGFGHKSDDVEKANRAFFLANKFKLRTISENLIVRKSHFRNSSLHNRIMLLAEILASNLKLFSHWKEMFQIHQNAKIGQDPRSFFKEMMSTGTRSVRLSEDKFWIMVANDLIPLLKCYYQIYSNESQLNDILFFKHIKPENNSIIESYRQNEFKMESMMDSQGLLELNDRFCKKQKCHKCPVLTKAKGL